MVPQQPSPDELDDAVPSDDVANQDRSSLIPDILGYDPLKPDLSKWDKPAPTTRPDESYGVSPLVPIIKLVVMEQRMRNLLRDRFLS